MLFLLSLLVFTLTPFTLVRIGPNLDAALNGLISSLTAALGSNRNNIRNFATTQFDGLGDRLYGYR
jgi:hypothetical protein